MKKIVKIVWGASAPWYDEKAEAMQVRMSYLESKFLAGLTTDVDGNHYNHDFSIVDREWVDQAAAEEEVAWVTAFAQTHSLIITSIEIRDSA